MFDRYRSAHSWRDLTGSIQDTMFPRVLALAHRSQQKLLYFRRYLTCELVRVSVNSCKNQHTLYAKIACLPLELHSVCHRTYIDGCWYKHWRIIRYG